MQGADGPFDDSDEPFAVRYYTIYWRVYDLKELRPLNELSVVDSSGWSTSGVSTVEGPIPHDYRWGYWNTVWYRRFYNDAPVVNWNPETGGRAVWTQEVFMTRSEVEPDYRVLANFAYDFATKNFTTYAWLERGGVIQSAPTKCVITVYDASGAQIKELINTRPKGNGVFVTIWDASDLAPRELYFAKVEIEFAGLFYSSGVTFNLQVTAGEAAIADIVGRAESNILAGISGVSNEVAGVGEAVRGLQRDMTNLTALSEQSTNLLQALGALTNTLAFLSNEMVSVVGPAITNVDALVSQISEDAESGLARILTRPTTVESNATLSVLFKTRRGFGNNAVTLTVTPGGLTTPMAELVGGIYQADLTANWPLGAYTIACTDPAGNSDRIIVDVVARGALADVPVALSTITGQLHSIQVTLYAMTNVNWNAISNVAADVAAITQALYAVDWDALTNFSAAIGDLPADVAALTNRLLGVNWSALTNVAQDMAVITQALGNVNWQDILDIHRGVTSLTNLIASGSFPTNLLPTITNAIGGVSTNVEWMARQFQQVNWASLTNVADSLNAMTSTFARVNWEALTNVAVNVGAVTQAIGQVNWGALTNVSAQMTAITSAIYSVNWAALTNVSYDMATITNALGGMSWSEMRDTIASLSNRLAEVNWPSLTNVAADVGTITSALARIDWNSLSNVQATVGQVTSAIYSVNWGALTNVAGDLATVTNALGGMSWSEMRDTIAGLSNRLAQVNWASLTNVSADIGRITNVIANLNVGALTNLARDVNAITTALYAVQWGDLTNAAASVAGVSSGVAALTNRLLQVDWQAITNVSREMTIITNALGNMRWSDVLNIANNVTALRTDLSQVDWTALVNLPATDLGALAATVAQQVELKVGSPDDAPGAKSIFGQLAALERGLAAVGGEASQAAKKAQSARSEAGAATKGVKDLKQEVGEGNVEGIRRTIEQIREALTAAQKEIQDIPELIGPQRAQAQMQQMAEAIEKLAASKGFQYLVGLEELPAPGAGGAGLDTETVGKFNKNFQEIQSSMQFMQKLLDEMRYEPVVEESLIGAP